MYLIDTISDTKKIPINYFVAFIGLFILSILINNENKIFELGMLVWILLFLQLINNHYLTLIASKIISSRLVFWIFFFSISISIIIIKENEVKENEQRKHYAETLSRKADPSSERLFNTVLTDFRSDVLAPFIPKF